MSTAAVSSRSAWPERLVLELHGADQRAERLARGLSAQQLNRRPADGGWSVGQCLEHLYATNQVYLPAIESALHGRSRSRTEEIHLGWFSRWFIRNYIAENPDGRRARAPGKVTPASEVDPEILDALLRSNQAARALIARAAEYDVNRIRFRNPFTSLIRFTVGTGLEIVVKHEGRHLLQAERVRDSFLP